MILCCQILNRNPLCEFWKGLSTKQGDLAALSGHSTETTIGLEKQIVGRKECNVRGEVLPGSPGIVMWQSWPSELNLLQRLVRQYSREGLCLAQANADLIPGTPSGSLSTKRSPGYRAGSYPKHCHVWSSNKSHAKQSPPDSNALPGISPEISYSAFTGPK